MTRSAARTVADGSVVLAAIAVGMILTAGACWSLAQTMPGPGERSLPQLHVVSGRVIAAAGLLLSQALMLAVLSFVTHGTRRLHRTASIVLLLLSMIALVAGAGLRLAR